MERSLEQWRDTLYARLVTRRGNFTRPRDYFLGRQVLTPAPSATDANFRRLAQLGVTNVCGLAVSTIANRMIPQGVRLSNSQEADTQVWRDIWQANGLDGYFPPAVEETLKVGYGPILVWPNMENPARPFVTMEDPDEVIVAYDRGTRRRRVAALKVYCADDDTEFAQVWTATEVKAWVKPAASDVWIDDPDVDKSGPNPLGRVPVVEMLSKPDIKGVPRPELSADVLSKQDAINKTMFDAVIAAEFGAFPQRYTIGIEIVKDDDGNPINPLTTGPDRVWTLTKSQGETGEAKIGQLEPYEIAGLLSLANEEIKQFASTSQTPIFYLMAGMTNVGADTVRAAERGQVDKTRNHCTVCGEALEEAIRLALIAQQVADGEMVEPPADIEILWAPIETRSPAEIADAGLKDRQAGFPLEQIAEERGATPSEIERMQTAPEVLPTPVG